MKKDSFASSYSCNWCAAHFRAPARTPKAPSGRMNYTISFCITSPVLDSRPAKWRFWHMPPGIDRTRGAFPESIGSDKQNEYDLATIKSWLRIFLRRFFQSQFKRTCVPNGPKVGSGGSLSPRGDWRMPSDANAAVWIAELEKNVPELQ